ncbi:unnamed protein product [Hanseniaspora opuntiae]
MDPNKNNEDRRESQTSYLSDTSNIFKKYIPLETYHVENVHDDEQDHDYNVFKKGRVSKSKLICVFIALCTIFLLIALHIISKPSFPPYSINSNTNINLSGRDLLRFFDDEVYAGHDAHSYYDSFSGYVDHVSTRLDISQAELLTRDVTVLKYIHSHNDYWRKLPFFDALLYGVNSIEADIWLTDDKTESILAVGHNKDYLKPSTRNLNSLYLKPIKKILDQVNPSNSDDKLNGLFFDSPEVPTVLFIDFKDDETKNLHAYDELIKQLRPLKRYLTTQLDFDKNQFKPLIIELTGNYPQLGTHEDFIFLDSSMIDVFQKKVELKSPVISESLNKLIGFCKSDENMTLEKIGSLDSDDIQICLKAIINKLHDQNYKVRIWDVPQFPIYKRDKLWKQQLEDFNVDFLNVDDLDSVSNF